MVGPGIGVEVVAFPRASVGRSDVIPESFGETLVVGDAPAADPVVKAVSEIVNYDVGVLGVVDTTGPKGEVVFRCKVVRVVVPIDTMGIKADTTSVLKGLNVELKFLCEVPHNVVNVIVTVDSLKLRTAPVV